MATQTRLIARRSVRFLRDTIGAYMIVAFSGLILLSAVSAYAAQPLNSMPFQVMPINGMTTMP
jgi:hypothetical protein